MMARGASASLLLVIMAALIGCASGGEPTSQALDRAEGTIGAGIDRGMDAVESQREVDLRGRYNPCQCPAPQFELYVRGRWERVILGGDEELIENIRAQLQAEEDLGRLVHAEMRGRFDGRKIFEQTGVEYEYFRVDHAELKTD